LESQPALSVCLLFSTAAFVSDSNGAWMQCTSRVESSCWLSLRTYAYACAYAHAYAYAYAYA
jgi:hypothetical protein